MENGKRWMVLAAICIASLVAVVGFWAWYTKESPVELSESAKSLLKDIVVIEDTLGVSVNESSQAEAIRCSRSTTPMRC